MIVAIGFIALRLTARDAFRAKAAPPAGADRPTKRAPAGPLSAPEN